jgi:hypothetical protein
VGINFRADKLIALILMRISREVGHKVKVILGAYRERFLLLIIRYMPLFNLFFAFHFRAVLWLKG